MEALLRKLEENQQMTDEAASRLQPIEIPPKKYKSIFCIDGKPILPPLMTLEKRKEMQKFKQEAIKIERKLKKQYSRQHVCDEHNAEADESTFASLSSFCCDNISQISQISYEEADGIKQSQQKSSMLMLNDMLMIKHIDDFRNVGGADGIGDGITSNNMKSQLFTSATGLQQYNKIQKLTKSQTLIYDLTKNSEEDGKVQLKKQILEIAHEKNNSAAKYKLTKRPTYLCLNNNHNTDHSDNVGKNVPTIYINPPTPLMDEKDNITMLRKSLKTCGKHSKDSAAATTATTTTSDDSSDSQYFRGAKMNRRHSNNKTALVKAAEATAAAITSPSETSEIIRQRIKQFEEVYNQNDSPKTATASSNRSSSPEKDFRDIDSQKTNFDSLEIPSALSRSATSPSLRSTHNKNNSLPSNSVYLETPQATPESDLIRSNSFTLKVPSKALIDHMRQQQQQKQQQLQQQQQQQYFQYPTQHSHHQQIVIKSNKNNVMTRTRGLSPAKTQSRLTQDTVESKAKKKVCKVESKTSRSILQSKNSSSKFNSPSNATSLTTPSPTSSFMQYSYPSVYNSNGNNNQKNYNKSKRSPYESAASSSSSLTKSCTRKLLINSVANNASALNKSIKIQQSSCTSQKTQLQVKRQQQQQQQQQQEQQQQQQQQLQEQQQLQQQNTYDIIENSTLPIAVNLMVGEKKELFMQLLAQQEEERRKLQAAFEMQQKILLDELNESESIKYQLNNDNYHQHQHQHMHQYQHLQNQYYQQQPIQQHLNGNANDSQLADNSINDRMQSTPDKSTSVLSYNNSGISIRELSSMIKNESSSLTSLQNNVHNVNNYGVNNVLSSTDSFPSTSEQINVMRKTLANNNVAATSKQNSTNSINLNNSSSSLKSIKSTPRRRLFLQDMTTLNICNLKTTCNNNNNNKSITLNDGHFVDDREAAATTINAYVRGYLVRRLFQTEHIQRFVQTIRDTLIFILHLHMESIQNPQEAVKPVNVKLKGRLLQQLYSTNRRLHAVLFETTIMERMNIIAQDRKRLRNKLQKK